MSKDRLYEVSKRLGIPAKAATEILRSNGYYVKNNMTILTESEISLLRGHFSIQTETVFQRADGCSHLEVMTSQVDSVATNDDPNNKEKKHAY